MKITPELFFECYNFYKNKNYSDRSLDILKTNLKKFDQYMRATVGEYELSNITYKVLEDYKTKLSETRVNKHSIYYWKRKFIHPKTVQMKIQSVKNFLKFMNFIYGDGIDHRNIEIPRITQHHINFLEEREVEQLLEVVDQEEKTEIWKQRSKLLIAIGYSTGLRLAEILNLTVDEVKEWQSRIVGKWSRERLVFFLPKIQNQLSEYLETLKKPLPHTWTIGKRTTKEKYVFISHNPDTFGQKLSKETVCWLFKKYNEKLNIPGKRISCHALRHSFATRLMDKNVNLREIQTLLGHADLKTTEGYTHVRSPQLEQAHKLAFEDFW